MLKKCLFVLMLSAITIGVQAKSTSIVLRVLKKEQSDTLGYNIFNYLPNLVYRLVNEDNLGIWDPQHQGKKLSAADIRNIEKVNLVSFADVNLIYLYEVVDANSVDSSMTVIGMTFGIYKGGGKEMLFGYVFFDELKEYLQPIQMTMGMNGCGTSNLCTVVNNNWFDFSVNKYDDQPVKPAKQKSVKNLINLASANRKDADKLDISKRVNYIISRVADKSDIKSKNTNTLLDSTAYFIKTHADQFFLPTVSDSTIRDMQLTSILVEDIWYQNESFVYFKPIKLTLVLQSVSQQQLVTVTDLSKIALVLDFSKFEDFIKQKQYFFIINSINDDAVEAKDSAHLYKTLVDGNWRQLSKF